MAYVYSFVFIGIILRVAQPEIPSERARKLGLLAAATINGNISIYAILDPDDLQTEGNTEGPIFGMGHNFEKSSSNTSTKLRARPSCSFLYPIRGAIASIGLTAKLLQLAAPTAS